MKLNIKWLLSLLIMLSGFLLEASPPPEIPPSFDYEYVYHIQKDQAISIQADYVLSYKANSIEVLRPTEIYLGVNWNEARFYAARNLPSKSIIGYGTESSVYTLLNLKKGYSGVYCWQNSWFIQAPAV